jgi:neutral ceramidase
VTALAAAGAAIALVPAVANAAPQLEVGVGRADITPPTGYSMMGWVRSDGVIQGQNTRLWARVIVLKEGDQKVALVAEDLNGIPGGMMKAAADLDKDIGFSEQNVLDSASHTHAAPTSFYNFSTYNDVFMTLRSPTDFNLTGSLDPQLYTFMVQRLALAIRRANANLGPGEAGWGVTQIDDLTQNRSIEAHLYDYGIHVPYGQGNPDMDPLGRLNTIDPDANVLRVDKLLGGRYVPVGMWSTFANHGTVNKFQFDVYNEDHHGAATHLSEAAIRRDGHVPAGQDVVNAYGNTDEGDISSGIVRSGPAAADWVGQVEANAFMYAWRQAGKNMQKSPAMDRRWTRMCWCGQQTPDGPVADHGAFGMAEFTGSEEGRGPLYEVTRQPFEGDALPLGAGPDIPVVSGATGVGGPQGDKITVPISLDIPKAVPLMALRIGDHMIVSIPGEMTEEMGRRVRAAVTKNVAGSGVTSTVISGLANEYADYFTTPQEFDAQHYEGAATVYGRASSDALQQVLVELAGDLVNGKPAQAPYDYDPQNGINADAAPFPTGAVSGTVVSQPGPPAPRLSHPTFSWRGGDRGFDRPVDRPFVLVQREVQVSGKAWHLNRNRRGHRHLRGGIRAAASARRRGHKHRQPSTRTPARPEWQTVDSDLGLAMLWTVDSDGTYHAEWEPPLDTPVGTYRFVVQANRYQLTSATFQVVPNRGLTITRTGAAPGHVALQLHYPPAIQHQQVGDSPGDTQADLTYRPDSASSGKATFIVNGRNVTVSAGPNGVFDIPVPGGSEADVKPGAVTDQWGNANFEGLGLRP